MLAGMTDEKTSVLTVADFPIAMRLVEKLRSHLIRIRAGTDVLKGTCGSERSYNEFVQMVGNLDEVIVASDVTFELEKTIKSIFLSTLGMWLMEQVFRKREMILVTGAEMTRGDEGRVQPYAFVGHDDSASDGTPIKTTWILVVEDEDVMAHLLTEHEFTLPMTAVPLHEFICDVRGMLDSDAPLDGIEFLVGTPDGCSIPIYNACTIGGYAFAINAHNDQMEVFHELKRQRMV